MNHPDKKEEHDFFNKIRMVMDKVNQKEMELGKEYIQECPLCGGELHASKNTYNGHISVFCKGCKFFLMS